MWRSKKFILAMVLVAVIAAVSIGGAVMAADDGNGNQAEEQCETFIDRVLEIYEEQTGVAIDEEVLRDAFGQARGEFRDERIQERLAELVEEGVITQEEADELWQWWLSRPETLTGLGICDRIQARIQLHTRLQNQSCDQLQSQSRTQSQDQSCLQSGSGNGHHGAD